MSFLDTLKNLGLWQGQQPQAAQPNPYGLDPQMMQMARSQALGNIGGQILAMSQQMTPDQRARMMAGADWTGGYQNSLYNAAQMQLMSDAQRRRQAESERDRQAQKYIRGLIQQNPNDPRAKKAAIYAQLGDWGSAAKAFTETPNMSAMQEKIALLEQSGVDRNTAIGIATGRFQVTTDPFTNTQRITDLGGNSIQAPGQSVGGVPQSDGALPTPQPNGGASGVTLDQLTQGTIGVDARKAGEKAIVEKNAALRTNAEGAVGFLTKIKNTENTIDGMNDSDFGPVQGDRESALVGTANMLTKSVADWWSGDNSLSRQDAFMRDLADLELDVANMKLKGTGQITDTERAIARKTLGGLTSADKDTAMRALQATKVEAALKIRDALKARVLTIEDLTSAGIDPNEVVQILVSAGALEAGSQTAPPSPAPNVKIRQISPGVK